MPRLTIYKDNHEDSTVVSNRFIDEYMKDANDAQIKVYLYLLRMMDAHQATSVSDIADKFNHTEKDVIRALSYWEKRRLLDLDYDSGKNLVGIHIRELSMENAADTGCGPQTVPSFVPTPASGTCAFPKLSAFSADGLGTFSAFSADGSENPPALSGDGRESSSAFSVDSRSLSFSQTPEETSPDPYAKPSYSADQLREFKSRQDTAQLLFIAESYIGRPLTPSEIKTILYFMDVLHFSDDLVDYLIQYCVDRDKKDFKYIEKVAVSWAEQGITTPKQAQKSASRYDKNVYAIMNGLGKSGSPTAKEMEYITRWMKDYDFSTDIIIEACERTVLATDKHRFEYAESILSSWKDQNVHHKTDIRGIDARYQQRRKASAAPQKPSSNRFNQFAQNQYDFDALEQELLSNQAGAAQL